MKKVFHFCGCVTEYLLIGGEWKLVLFAQRCVWRWRMGHFGWSRDQEAEGEIDRSTMYAFGCSDYDQRPGSKPPKA
jgi:hypothetical protein